MRGRKTLTLLLVAVVALSGASFITGWAEEEEATKDDTASKEKTFELVGLKKCKMCHSKEASGDQFGLWSKGPHAKAFETLANEKSLALAKELELGNPQEEPACLRCHATAFPVLEDIANQKITLEEGVSCESCHGPGGDYWTKKTMTAIYNEEVSGDSVGLLKITEETCTACHNTESPTYKEFDYEKRLAEVLHPYPEGYTPKE